MFHEPTSPPQEESRKNANNAILTKTYEKALVFSYKGNFNKCISPWNLDNLDGAARTPSGCDTKRLGPARGTDGRAPYVEAGAGAQTAPATHPGNKYDVRRPPPHSDMANS